MNVKELIKKLEMYDPEALVTFTLNPTRDHLKDCSEFDVEMDFELAGSEEYPDMFCSLTNKSRLDSISELVCETKDELNIKMTNDGIFVFKDNQLVRELEIKYDNYNNVYNNDYMNKKPEEYIKMLLRIL